jgi:hypothetical protein
LGFLRVLGVGVRDGAEELEEFLDGLRSLRNSWMG